MISVLLRHLDRERFRPSLALLRRTGPFLADVPTDVVVHDLRERSPYNAWGSVLRLRRVIDSVRPRVVLSALKHPNLITLAVGGIFFRDLPIVISEHTTPSDTLQTGRGRHLKRFLHRRVYPRARRIITVSHGVKRDLERSFGIAAGQIQVIHNPCEIDRIERRAREAPTVPVDWSIPTVLAVGRLTRVKGFSYLLEAVASVVRRRPVQLVILGEGETRVALTRQAAELGVASRVLMPGFQANPFACMARARVCVASSLSEGFPNAIVEAMACGAPVIATDCLSGPREIIETGVNGLLVPPADPQRLADEIARVLDDSALAKRLAEAGRARAQAFAAREIVRQYENALDGLSRPA
jgi:glycosyltransferase involved in cell wall biosynthesis